MEPFGIGNAFGDPAGGFKPFEKGLKIPNFFNNASPD